MITGPSLFAFLNKLVGPHPRRHAEDDIRYIDWKVTARMAAPYVRQYMEEREVTASFLLDLSPSMDFGTARADKRGVMVDLVGTLARLLTRHGNHVGAMMFGNGIQRTIPARSGRIQVLRLVNDMLHQPRLQKASTNLKSFFNGALFSIKRRSLIFVVSDFISEPGWERSLSLLNRRHEVIAVRLFDPRELELPDVGMVMLEDSETGGQMFVDTHDKKFRKRFADASLKRERELSESFQRAGVDVLLAFDGCGPGACDREGCQTEAAGEEALNTKDTT